MRFDWQPFHNFCSSNTFLKRISNIWRILSWRTSFAQILDRQLLKVPYAHIAASAQKSRIRYRNRSRHPPRPGSWSYYIYMYIYIYISFEIPKIFELKKDIQLNFSNLFEIFENSIYNMFFCFRFFDHSHVFEQFVFMSLFCPQVNDVALDSHLRKWHCTRYRLLLGALFNRTSMFES